MVDGIPARKRVSPDFYQIFFKGELAQKRIVKGIVSDGPLHVAPVVVELNHPHVAALIECAFAHRFEVGGQRQLFERAVKIGEPIVAVRDVAEGARGDLRDGRGDGIAPILFSDGVADERMAVRAEDDAVFRPISGIFHLFHRGDLVRLEFVRIRERRLADISHAVREGDRLDVFIAVKILDLRD